MRRYVARGVPFVLGVQALALSGCQTAGLRILSFVGFEREPVVVALTLDHRPFTAAAQVLNPFPSYAGLQRALAHELKRPVTIDVCFPFQVQSGLDSGWYDLAAITPAHYSSLPNRATYRVLAVPIDRHGMTARSALLVVPANSELNAIADLRGRTVAFGPPGDSRTHHAALQLLRAGGLERTDLALELLPVPGGLKHMPDARGVAQSVLAGSSAAGFIDEADWLDFPEQAAGGDEPARDKLRVIGWTAVLPGRMIVSSPKFDERLAERVRQSLLELAHTHPGVLKELRIKGYAACKPDLLAACEALGLPPDQASDLPADEPKE